MTTEELNEYCKLHPLKPTIIDELECIDNKILITLKDGTIIEGYSDFVDEDEEPGKRFLRFIISPTDSIYLEDDDIASYKIV